MLAQHKVDSKLITLENGATSYVINDDNRWIGFDFDGTLAHFDHWRGIEHTGEPLQPAVDLVNQLLSEGKHVRIFTARVNDILSYIRYNNPCFLGYSNREIVPLREKIEIDCVARYFIKDWSCRVFGRALPVTNTKDVYCTRIYDDIAVQMVPNTGKPLSKSERAEYLADKGAKPGA